MGVMWLRLKPYLPQNACGSLVCVSLMLVCLSVALTGCRLCPAVADTYFRLPGALRISILYHIVVATGANSHPCSACASLARPVPALPVVDEILSAPGRLQKLYPQSAEQSCHSVKHWKDTLFIQRETHARRSTAFCGIGCISAIEYIKTPLQHFQIPQFLR